jgi:uncharacterized protein DUF6602
MGKTTHDLIDFLQNVTFDLAREYDRIQKRVVEDPGTAGDQGEENWATLLRQWLPSSYKVVTKGRILGHEGQPSPQVDILVLRPGYPKYLRNIKHYLAGGVAAAFECKITLRSNHIDKAVENAAKIRRLLPSRQGTPYKEMSSPLIYGLLAHSHDWNKPRSNPVRNVQSCLLIQDRKHIQHPREMMDLLCIANLGTWVAHKIAKLPVGPHVFQPVGETNAAVFPPAFTGYTMHAIPRLDRESHFAPVGALLYSLISKMAWEDSSIQHIARDFGLVDVAGPGIGKLRPWPFSIYSERVTCSWRSADPTRDWDEWGEDVG